MSEERQLKFELRWFILEGEDNRVVEVKDVLVWGRWLEDHQDDRVVGYTQVTSACRVSTVFLGLDHRFFGDGPPLIFETMIFGGPDEIDEHQWRYSSWDDAEVGHEAAVRKARKALKQKIE